LELGAVDFIAKPARREDFESLARELPAKIKLAATVDVAAKKSTRLQIKKARHPKACIGTCQIEAVVIGTSTGGPSALQHVIPKLPPDFPAVLIVQHMPKGFTKALAERLDQNSCLTVKEAEEGDVVKTGMALVAPAGKQMYLEQKPGRICVSLRDDIPVPTLFKPSVDVIMLSAAEVFREKLLGVIMTGMGSDGVRGLKKVREYGGKTFAEAEETCVVFGMPKAAIQAGVIDEVQPLHRLAGRIIEVVKR